LANWKTVLTHFVNDVEDEFDRLKYKLYHRLGGPDKIQILPYRGYGNREVIFLKGRVLEDHNIQPAGENDNIWDNLVNMYRRIESDELPHTRLKARYQNQEVEVTADHEGFFEIYLHPQDPLPEQQSWQKVKLLLTDPRYIHKHPQVFAEGEVFVPSSNARFVVVSDVDDTLIKTDAAHLLRMARNIFLGNAKTRLPFPGAAAFYRALHAGHSGQENNPLYFVSSSPWNLYDLLVDFFHIHEIPGGPVLFLRDWGISEHEILPLNNFPHKLDTIRNMLNFYPDLPFILVGDSSQQDPEIYAQLVEEFPERIQAIYIRNVSSKLDRPESIRALAQKVVESGSVLILANDTYALAKHAVEKGWINPDRLSEINAEKVKDEEPATLLEKLVEDEEIEEEPGIKIEDGKIEETKQVADVDSIESELEETGKEGSKAPPDIIVDENTSTKSTQSDKTEQNTRRGE
jgi:phosphatidate phosphatase APP1